MANTWQAAATIVARTGFSAFNAALTPLSAFSTDLSSDVAEFGSAVTTRIVPVSTAAVSLATHGARNDTHVAPDITNTLVTVTLNQDPIMGFYMTDEEAAQIASGAREDTKSRAAAQAAYAVAKSILDYVFALFTNANYSTAVATIASSAWEYDDVIDCQTALSGTYSWTQGAPWWMVLNSTYYGALLKDNALHDMSASGMDVVGSGEIRKCGRFNVIEAPTLPSNSENLVGLCTQKPAVSIAMRATPCQAPDRLEAYEVMTDPVTGVTLVFRMWYDANYGRMYQTFEALYGASKAQVEAGKRITSA